MNGEFFSNLLEGITKGNAVEREAINELDNVKCRFVPHVQAASVGQWLVIKNSDRILFALSDTRGNYRLDEVPVGKFRLEFWQPELGTKVEPFNMVRGGEVLTLT